MNKRSFLSTTPFSIHVRAREQSLNEVYTLLVVCIFVYNVYRYTSSIGTSVGSSTNCSEEKFTPNPIHSIYFEQSTESIKLSICDVNSLTK